MNHYIRFIMASQSFHSVGPKKNAVHDESYQVLPGNFVHKSRRLRKLLFSRDIFLRTAFSFAAYLFTIFGHVVIAFCKIYDYKLLSKRL